MSKIVPVSSENFDAVVLGSELPVLVVIGAPWCVDCRRARPFVEKFAEEFDGRLVVAGIDSEQSPELKEKFEVKHIPTMFFVKNGVASPERLVEVKTIGELKAFIEAGLA